MHTWNEAMAVTCDVVAAVALFAYWVQHGLATEEAHA